MELLSLFLTYNMLWLKIYRWVILLRVRMMLEAFTSHLTEHVSIVYYNNNPQMQGKYISSVQKLYTRVIWA